MLEIIEVQHRDLGEFIKLPFSLYADDPFFASPLIRELKAHFSGKNPFFRHAEAKYFLARKAGRNVGRIVSCINRHHNEFHGEQVGFFGFFESINDPAVSGELFNRGSEHLAKQGMHVLRGPMSFSTNEECGMLLEGFDEPPMLMTPYNPPYYNDLCEQYGFVKVKDLFGYIHEVTDSLPEKILRVADIAVKKGITVRPIRKAKFNEDMMIFKEIYNSAWQKNWGFIPLTDEELHYSSERLKQIAIPDLILIAEDQGAPVGFLGMLPDFNVVLRQMKGKLNPLTILKALFHSKKIADVRLLLLGIREEYRNRGVDALLYREGFRGLRKGGYKRVESSWILEDNVPVQRIIEMGNGRLYKKYRIYEKPL